MERLPILDREKRGGTRPQDPVQGGGEPDHRYDFDHENQNHQFQKLDHLNDHYQYLYHDEMLK